GGAQPPVYKPISRFGYRPRQTMLSLADVGSGHLAVTLRQKELLDGVVVHHEYIDRETKAVAPYRMIDPRLDAVLTLHAAGAAPVTVSFGRPNYQPDFKTDPVTPVHQTAAAASAVFHNGVADVKVAMDGLTASEAIRFMKGVAHDTIRREDQYLSSAFNLNSPIVDDRPETVARAGKPV